MKLVKQNITDFYVINGRYYFGVPLYKSIEKNQLNYIRERGPYFRIPDSLVDEITTSFRAPRRISLMSNIVWGGNLR